MDTHDLGEFWLIQRLRDKLPAADPRLVVGPGDDAAVWQNGDAYTLATTDTLVAGVHFLPERVAWRDVGWKALAVNVSDIAAMGGTPSFALVTLCLPEDIAVEAIDELYDGLRECAEAYGVTIAGGDIVSSPVFAITIALNGEADAANGGGPAILRRGAARAGDVIAVTGPIGGSAGGLRALLDRRNDGIARELIARHMRPWPRLDAGRAAVDAGIRCAIDISDGLVQDLGHICDASGVGAEVRVDALPFDEALLRAYPDDATTLAASGGEDYELVLVAPEAAIKDAEERLGSTLPIIGRIVEGAGVVVLDAAGNHIDLPKAGWDHLAQAHQP
jgi:thiamine-monophosphate kinase